MGEEETGPAPVAIRVREVGDKCQLILKSAEHRGGRYGLSPDRVRSMSYLQVSMFITVTVKGNHIVARLRKLS